MPRFAANLSMMYTEFEFTERFAAAAKDGFKGVEYLFPYDYAAQTLRDLLDAHGLEQVLFNAPPGNWAQNERGIASLPGREDEFKQGFDLALEYARVLGNRTLHVMAGLIQPDQDREKHRAVYLSNLAYAALLAAREGITVVIEPINTRDIPGYFLNRQDEAQEICAEVGVENLRVQFDIYHCQIVEGDVASKLKRDISRPHAGIAHIQIAGVPDRHEPDLGEVNYPYLFQLIDELGYQGWIGCEYRPKAQTSAGLSWLSAWIR
ncbi:2-oxo-tetronate isomerase [Undibacterium sp. TS12]|uniref:2-oxo-tetronate isomerase n=1 Tax=Undibacterium sp. TS12 TaxID=2908202 RepID=UPI001F4CC464|nr:2-oxo-tetronate isomerase [Undibacterium sp. TS12]MCH8618992.1 hydroxypyruvate isomerase family protein [Undibacterium sp. TS12]